MLDARLSSRRVFDGATRGTAVCACTPTGLCRMAASVRTWITHLMGMTSMSVWMRQIGTVCAGPPPVMGVLRKRYPDEHARRGEGCKARTMGR